MNSRIQMKWFIKYIDIIYRYTDDIHHRFTLKKPQNVQSCRGSPVCKSIQGLHEQLWCWVCCSVVSTTSAWGSLYGSFYYERGCVTVPIRGSYGVLTGFLLTVACLGIAIQYNSGILFLFGFLVFPLVSRLSPHFFRPCLLSFGCLGMHDVGFLCWCLPRAFSVFPNGFLMLWDVLFRFCLFMILFLSASACLLCLFSSEF
jgi:hypothetical protein